MTKPIVVFRNLTNAPKKNVNLSRYRYIQIKKDNKPDDLQHNHTA